MNIITCVLVRWKTVVASNITTLTKVQMVYVQYSSRSHNSAQNTWQWVVVAWHVVQTK